MEDKTVKALWPWFFRPYGGWSFDTDKLGGPRIGAEAGYFLKLDETTDSEKIMDVSGLDFGLFGETDPTKPSLWRTGGLLRWKQTFGMLFSGAVGTGISVRNASENGSNVQTGVPFEGQIGIMFDTILVGGGLVYYPDAEPIGKFTVGTDLVKLFTILSETSSISNN